MTDNLVFVFCHGRRVIAHQLDGWWRCGCCGRRLYEVGKTYMVSA